MIFLPLALSDFTIRIYDLSFTIKHGFSELTFINFAIFPFELTWTIYLIIFKVSFQNSILSLNGSLSFSFSVFKLSVIFYTSFSFNSSKLIMHQTFTKLTVVFASSVLPCVCTRALFDSRSKPSDITCALFIVSLYPITLRMTIFPSTFESINIFMSKYTLSIHG